MISKVTAGLVGAVLILSLYNTYQISNIEVKNVLGGENSSVATSTPNITPPTNSVLPSNPTQPQITPAINPAQTTQPTGPTTAIKFKKEEHDFGKVNVGTENKYSFEFTNTGTEPLSITNARGSCGCTVPQWPREPIMPGQSSKIDVVFKPSEGQAGQPQTKTVTVTANTEPANTIVKIKAFVNPK